MRHRQCHRRTHYVTVWPWISENIPLTTRGMMIQTLEPVLGPRYYLASYLHVSWQFAQLDYVSLTRGFGRGSPSETWEKIPQVESTSFCSQRPMPRLVLPAWRADLGISCSTIINNNLLSGLSAESLLQVHCRKLHIKRSLITHWQY